MLQGLGEKIFDYARRIEATTERCHKCGGACCDEIAVVFVQYGPSGNEVIDTQRITGDIARSFLDTVPRPWRRRC